MITAFRACILLFLLPLFAPALPASANASGFAEFAPMNTRGTTRSVGLSADQSTLTLTDGGPQEASSAFLAAPQTVAGWKAEWTFQATDFGGDKPGGADGIAFVLQNDPRGLKALGDDGGALGYGGGQGITKSIAFRLNIFGESGVDVGVNGSSVDYGSTGPVDLRSGHPIHVTLEFNGATLIETLQDTDTGQIYTNTDSFDQAGALGGTSAYVGFSGGSGAATARQTVRDFQFTTQTAAAKYVAPPPPAPKMHHTLASYVDPLIGTAGDGNVFPGASAPFGMTQFSPDTRTPSLGYTYSSRTIQGFSLTHMSGVGCDDCGNIFLTATTGPIQTQTAEYQSPFSHRQESAAPGYYQVALKRWNINAELTATERTGVVRFTFPAGQPANILLPISHTLTQTSDADIRLVDSTTVEGSVRSKAFCNADGFYTVYFQLKLDRPFTSAGTWTGATLAENGKTAAQQGVQAPPVGAFLRFGQPQAPLAVTARIGISYVDLAGARRNLAQEVGSRDFDAVRQEAGEVWEKELKRIEISGATETQKTVFYTALYHCFLMPSLFNDTDGRYLGFDAAVHQSPKGRDVYANFSGWDIYRTEAPLLALLQPRRTQDMCQSIALMARQGGWVGRWPQANTYTNIMLGSPLTVVTAAAWAYGLHDFDMNALYLYLYKDATEAPPSGKPYQGQTHIADMNALGYIPDDKEGYGSVSQTEEDCLAYAALAHVADSLGKPVDARILTRRALNYRNTFDPETKFLRPRLADGSWYKPFDPTQSDRGYAEGTAWHYRWLVPQDVSGLIALFGGDEPFNAEMDKFFSYPQPTWSGQYYNPYNETDLQAPFLYVYSGQPWKTQARVHALLGQVYRTTPDGIPGNDDCGTMSAWYIFSALGLYPVNPGGSDFVLTAPLFPRAVVHLDAPYTAKTVTVEAPQVSPTNFYRQNLRVGGKEWPRPWLTHSDLMRGKTLTWTLGAEPDKEWGTAKALRPPSLTR